MIIDTGYPHDGRGDKDSYPHDGRADKDSYPHDRHTCDTFLNPNREIRNFWSGNLCLVSGGFHVAYFRLFLPKLKREI